VTGERVVEHEHYNVAGGFTVEELCTRMQEVGFKFEYKKLGSNPIRSLFAGSPKDKLQALANLRLTSHNVVQ
jgi:hypothetical protein